METRVKACAILICAFLLGAVVPAGTGATAQQKAGPATPPNDEAAIRKILDDHLAWTRAHDWQSIRTEFADDAVIMPDFQPTIVGREDIGTWFRENFEAEAAAQVTSKMTASLDEVQVLGNWAFDRGTFDITYTKKDGKEANYKLRFLEIFKKQPDGSWKIVRGTNNTLSVPSPAPK